jgi:hypothetical protein
MNGLSTSAGAWQAHFPRVVTALPTLVALDQPVRPAKANKFSLRVA